MDLAVLSVRNFKPCLSTLASTLIPSPTSFLSSSLFRTYSHLLQQHLSPFCILFLDSLCSSFCLTFRLSFSNTISFLLTKAGNVQSFSTKLEMTGRIAFILISGWLRVLSVSQITFLNRYTESNGARKARLNHKTATSKDPLLAVPLLLARRDCAPLDNLNQRSKR